MMKRRTALISLLAIGSTLTMPTYAAPPEGKGPGHQGGHSAHGNGAKRGPGPDDFTRRRDRDSLDSLVYAGITTALAREYALDYGLRGYSDLPPGIRKNLARGKPLPPGIAKKMIPSRFLDRLPRHPGYEWRIAGTDLLLISVATAIIADVLFDVFD